MDGPWYECTGPNADYVRRDQYRKYFENILICQLVLNLI